MKVDGMDEHIVSVIIPTIGRSTLSLTRKALGKQTRKPDEIIAVFDRQRKGRSWAMNRGILRAKGDLIAVVDDDCIPPDDWLERLITAIDKHDAAVAGGSYTETDSLLRDARKRRNFPHEEQVDINDFVGVGGNVLYKRSWLEQCEREDGFVFNEKFKTAEDRELAWRLKRYGVKFVFVPSNPIHLKKVDFWGYQKFQFHRGIGIAKLNRHRAKFPGFRVQKSILWEEKRGVAHKVFEILWRKILGPFDLKNFSTTRNFILFWLGEKSQGVGFIYGFLRKSSV